MKRTLIAGGIALSVVALAVLLVVTFTGRKEVPLQLGNPPEVNGNELTVHFVAHPTDSDPQAEVEEAADSVTITVTVDRGCSDCTDEGRSGSVTVTLDEPLGSRTVRDGSRD